MQYGMTREQLWEKLGQLDPFQQQSVADFVEFLLRSKAPADRRNKKELLALSVWNDEDIARIQEAQDGINAWNFPAS